MVPFFLGTRAAWSPWGFPLLSLLWTARVLGNAPPDPMSLRKSITLFRCSCDISCATEKPPSAPSPGSVPRRARLPQKMSFPLKDTQILAFPGEAWHREGRVASAIRCVDFLFQQIRPHLKRCNSKPEVRIYIHTHT